MDNLVLFDGEKTNPIKANFEQKIATAFGLAMTKDQESAFIGVHQRLMKLKKQSQFAGGKN